jgi:hypothetical protein
MDSPEHQKDAPAWMARIPCTADCGLCPRLHWRGMRASKDAARARVAIGPCVVHEVGHAPM